MPIQFNCPYCTATVRVPDTAAGKAGRCPKCETKIRIPEIGAAAAATAAPSPLAAMSSGSSPAPPVVKPPKPAPSAGAKGAKPAAQADPESFFASFGGAAPASESDRKSARSAPVPAAQPPAPSPFQAPEESVSTPEPVAAEGDEEAPLLLEASEEDEDGLYFSPDDDEEPGAGSVAAQLRNKRKPLSMGVILLPVLGIGVAAAIAFAYLKATEPKFVGDLSGERVTLKKPISVRVSWQEAGAVEEEQKAIRSLLDKKPLPLASSLLVVQFLSDAQGLLIEAKNGYDTDIVRVDPQAVPILANWLLKNGERLQLPRSTTIAPAAREFAGRLATTIQSQAQVKSSDYAEFRDRLAMPALNRTLGHWCGAVVDNQMYPCIYEDPQGLLYFAVPTNARFFQVREKGEEPGRMLPPTFLVNVTLPPRASANSPVSEPTAKPDAEVIEPMPEDGAAKEMPAEPEAAK